jgi:hypothetical protein
MRPSGHRLGARSGCRRSRALTRLPGHHALGRPGRGLSPSGLVLSLRLAQGRYPLGCQLHPPRPARCHLHPIECARFAPIGNRIHRDVKQSGRRLCTIATITALPAWASGWPQRASTLNPIGIPQPSDLAGRKRTALPTAIAVVIETLGNPHIGMIRGQLLDALNHLRRRAAYDVRRFGPRHFQRTTRVGLPAYIHTNRLRSLGQHHVLNEQAHHVFALGVGCGLRTPDRG